MTEARPDFSRVGINRQERARGPEPATHFNQSRDYEMASKNNPISSAELIRKHSKAKVVVPSKKQFKVGIDPLTGVPIMSLPLTDADVRESLVKKYCR